MEPAYDVVIIGGGVIGCAVARELARFELTVVLIEKQAEVGFGTSKTNSGIIHPGHDTSIDTLKGRLVVRGNALYDQLCSELHFGFRRIGEINVAQSEDELGTLRRLKEQGDRKGVPGLTLWDRAELQRQEPNLSRELLGALYAPSAGVINPYEFAFALIENATANGVELRVDSPVTAIEVGARALTLTTPKGTVSGRFVLNCAGVAADKIARMVGVETFEIFPRKGEEYMLDKRLMGLVRRLVFPLPTATTKGILIIPTFDGTIMVGPTAQSVADREDFATTPRGADEVFAAVRKLCPAVSARDAITAFAGLRAVSNTGDFVIEETAVPGFINVSGIQSPGLTSAPAIGEYVRDLLAQAGLQMAPKAHFDPFVKGPPRFARQTPEAQERLAADNPLFAKVVCRCELVTEAEIHDAVDHGARTLDGIKFRSRAGMGRCQGGFCTSRCLEILSRRLAVPVTAITKRGGDSWMVASMPDAAAEED